ncbi:helix-turn-helix domain-containing protein [Niabella beijingensis]|uniref:helix-turn-helix domain-containing protein n=1 Tax=Niabella beijingensis TaxID=2872700 RepID=UPI001CBF4A0F|nr:XRE family transcriptional regulator [Niabella beijingensis]MBZ4192384.1 XRE family transcriptional regulator [Niabella beijingensis]
MEDYLIGIGKRIKALRKNKGFTINNVAGKADLSNGLISRIENGRTIPSLPVLLTIINVLDVGIADFFKDIPLSGGKSFIVSRKEDNTIIEKEDEARGFEYRSLLGRQLSSVGFEAVLLEVQPGSQRDRVETDAFEFKYILSGECAYIIGEEEVSLREGDALFFDGRIPHVPVNRGKAAAKMIVMYFFLPKNE